ncbi:nuclear transport factor 2 family protein [Nocardioides sp. WS12]|uniref:nuclear transport factor 2 family protein n=1 Tax=Nocardioides sp. WS12 TaxID=2486272 RepID=UPI0015FE5EDD|nr:nuclear transport factor 2 family protein [Nocardioides sp. WS12]
MADYPFGPPARRNSVLVPLLIGLVAMALVAAAAVVVVLLAWPEDSKDDEGRASDGTSSGTSSAVSSRDRNEVREAAREAAVTLIDYDPRTLDGKAAAVAEVSTPEFASETLQTLDQIAPSVTESEATGRVTISADGIVGIDGDSAIVLMYLNQLTTRPGSDPVTTSSAATMLMAKVDGEWLADGLEVDAELDGPDERDDTRNEVLRAATTFGEAFTAFDHRTFEDDTTRVLSLSTGVFAQQYREGLADLERLSTASQTVSEGEAWSSGVADLGGDHATVLVATKGTVTDNRGESQARNYRLRLILDLVGGKWLVSDAEFVS